MAHSFLFFVHYIGLCYRSLTYAKPAFYLCGPLRPSPSPRIYNLYKVARGLGTGTNYLDTLWVTWSLCDRDMESLQVPANPKENSLAILTVLFVSFSTDFILSFMRYTFFASTFSKYDVIFHAFRPLWKQSLFWMSSSPTLFSVSSSIHCSSSFFSGRM